MPYARQEIQSVLALCHALAQLRSGDWKQFPLPSEPDNEHQCKQDAFYWAQRQALFEYSFQLFANV